MAEREEEMDGQSSSEESEEPWKTTIRNYYVQLVEDMNPDPLLDFLKKEGFARPAALRDIEEAPTTTVKNRKILDLVLRRDSRRFELFLPLLKRSGNDGLAKLLGFKDEEDSGDEADDKSQKDGEQPVKEMDNIQKHLVASYKNCMGWENPCQAWTEGWDIYVEPEIKINERKSDVGHMKKFDRQTPSADAPSFMDVVTIKNVIVAKYGSIPVTGRDLYNSVVASTAILSTGVQGLDSLLDGGLYTGEVTEIVGDLTAGKTQLCFSVCVTTALESTQEVLYIDTGGVFSATRLAQMVTDKGQGSKVRQVLSRIHCCCAYTIDEVCGILASVTAGILSRTEPYANLKLVMLDNVASVVYPFLGGGVFSESQGVLSSLGHQLKSLAVDFSLAVLVTNNVVTSQTGSKTASLGRLWSHVPHVRLMISSPAGEDFHGQRTLTVLKSSRGPTNVHGACKLS